MLFILIEDMDELFGNQVRCCMPYLNVLFCPFGQEFVRDLAHLLKGYSELIYIVRNRRELCRAPAIIGCLLFCLFYLGKADTNTHLAWAYLSRALQMSYFA